MIPDNKLRAWFCGALFCGALTALAQTVTDRPDTMVSAGVDASVKAGVSGSAGSQSSGGSPSFARLSSAFPESESTGVPESESSGSGLESAAAMPISSRTLSATEFKEKRLLMGTSASQKNRSANSARGPAATGRTAKAKEKTAKTKEETQPHLHGEESGGYARSGSFPDSTKGDALLSPPDSAADSPLLWTPGLAFGFPDIQNTQFLSPSLNIRAHRPAIPEQNSHPAIPKSPLKTRPTTASDLLQSTLHPSIDQQVGLAGAH